MLDVEEGRHLAGLEGAAHHSAGGVHALFHAHHTAHRDTKLTHANTYIIIRHASPYMFSMVPWSVELSMYSLGEGASTMVPKMLRMILLA